MKKMILVLGMFVSCAILVSELTAKPGKPLLLRKAAFNWNATTFDFGRIKMNVPVTHKFKFTNTGDEPLIIASVQASCGCTVTEYSKDPIPNGAEGYVKATYNAAKVGAFNKTVTVNANTETAVQLAIKGEVIE